MGGINTGLNTMLSTMGQTSKIALGLVLGGMMAIDMGGPFNKAAYVFGTAAIAAGKFDDEKLLEIVKKNFNFEVGNIISELDLRKPVYHKTSCYGHFGDPQFTWEKVKKLEY